MKAKKPLTLFFILALTVTASCTPQENRPNNPTVEASLSSGQILVTPENLEFLSFHFTPIDPTDPLLKESITQDQAVKSALTFDPAGTNAESISTQVGYFDNISVIDLQNHRLVWLVTYQGVDSVSSGPPGSEHTVADTLTVAVDAFDGNGIVSMTLAIATPEATLQLTPTVPLKP